MIALRCFALVITLGCALGFTGEYVPKSFYTLDEEGHKSPLVYLRKNFVSRARRGVDDPASIMETVRAGLRDTFNRVQQLQHEAEAQGGASGGHSFSRSFSSSGGPGGANAGPVLHSRFAGTGPGNYEKEYVSGGNGQVYASSSASGPHGGVSFSSSSVDSDGNVRYNTHAEKF